MDDTEIVASIRRGVFYLDQRILELQEKLSKKDTTVPVSDPSLVRSLKKFTDSGYKSIIGNKNYG